MHRLRRRWLARAVGGAAVLAAAGTGVWWFAVRDDAGAGEPTSTTQAVAASLSTLEKTVTASGTVAPTVDEEVSFGSGGTVTAVAVQAGQTVVAGQTLATIDTLTLNASLLAAKATLAEAGARLADAEDADDGTDVAQAQVDAAAAQVDVAQAAVDEATAAMADATLVAPAAGLVTEVNLAVGDVVGGSSGGGSTGSTGSTGGSAAQPGATTATASTSSTADVVIVGTDSWTVDVTVDDSEVALIEVGDQAELTLDEATGTVFGVVGEIGLVPTSTSGVPAYPVTITITGQPDGVYDGVDADVSIVYERRTDVLTVPSAAVRTVDGASTVTVAADDGGERSVPVTVGETVGDKTEIVDGLAEGDQVLVTVVTQTSGSDQGGQGGQGGQGFDPSQMQPPAGFDPSQMGDGAFPARPDQGSSNG